MSADDQVDMVYRVRNWPSRNIYKTVKLRRGGQSEFKGTSRHARPHGNFWYESMKREDYWAEPGGVPEVAEKFETFSG